MSTFAQAIGRSSEKTRAIIPAKPFGCDMISDFQWTSLFAGESEPCLRQVARRGRCVTALNSDPAVGGIDVT